MMQGYINWEKRQIQWWKKKLGLSEHGLACILTMQNFKYFNRIQS